VIKTEAVEIDLDDPAFASFQPKGSRHVLISIVDNGSGMDAKVMAQVFDPFFTTKPVGKGTGLGLSVLSTYVREIGGALNMSSRPGEGTTCSIYMPFSEQAECSIDTGSLAPDVSGNETVLLAEDEDIVAKATTMLLSHSGYNVIRCADGLEAVNTYRERRDEIDLVLLDYRMPVMTGAEAFLELRRLDPGVPVILMSGNLSLPEFSQLEKESLSAILKKPCSRLDLTAAVREAIDSRVRSS
jgi:CheY-like chemotaxis protein